MVVRLTHRAAPAQQHYTIPALTGSFSLTGVSTMFRAARKMDVPDKIPYLLTGQPVALSKKPPVWSAAPSYSITAGVASGPTAIPVSVPDGGSPIITVTWSATGTPSTKPSWITLNSGTSPTIQFTGAQTDGDDISGMVLSAVANSQPAVLSPSGTITVSASGTGLFISDFGNDLGLGDAPGGAIFYASMFASNDGKIIGCCTGDHNQFGNNAFREFDPLTGQETDVYQNNNGTVDWMQYDNLPHLYSSRTNCYIVMSRGVFARAAGTYAGVVQSTPNKWIIGNLISNGRNVIGTGATDFIRDGGITLAWLTSNFVYNPHNAWSDDLDCGVIISSAPGGSGSGATAVDAMWIFVRATNINPSYTQEYYVMQKTLPSSVSGAAPNKQNGRDGCCFLGEYVYWVGGSESITASPTGHFFRMKITPHLYSTGVTDLGIERLQDCPASGRFMLLTPDRYNSGLLCITDDGVFLFDLTTKTWSANVTPAGYQEDYNGTNLFGVLPENPVGGFVDERGGQQLRRTYFRPGGSFSWSMPFNEDIAWRTYRSIKLSRGGSRWRSVTVPSNGSPFEGFVELGFGTNKHVTGVWHPKHRRVYTCGGDFGGSAGNFGQPVPGGQFTTNAPSGAITHTSDLGGSLRQDQYSFDPYDLNKPWRLEQPYLPANNGGSPKNRPAMTDELGFTYDPVREKFWVLQNHIRDDQTLEENGAGGTTPFRSPIGQANPPDPWVHPTLIASTLSGTGWEQPGTFSWTPHPVGGAGNEGTFTLETAKYCWGTNTQTGQHLPPQYIGNCLRVMGCEEHGYLGKWEYYAPQDKFVSLAFPNGSNAGNLVFLSFDPTLPAEPYQWRRITISGTFSLFDGPAALAAIIGDYIYVPVCTRRVAGSVLESNIVKVNIPNMLALANGSTVSLSSTYMTTFLAPFSFSPANEWEGSGSLSHHWASEVGFCALGSTLVLIGSYGSMTSPDNALVVGGFTRLATRDEGAASPAWVAGESFPASPGDLQAQCWIPLPDTNEVMLVPANTSPQSKVWFYRVPEGTSSSTFTTSFDDPPENPINESGRWTNPQAAGFTDVQKSGGRAYGTQTPSSNYDDSYAYLSGFSNNHEIEGVIYKDNPQGVNHEIELHVRMSDDATNVHSYEFIFGFNQAFQVMRWNGPMGPSFFTDITSNGSPPFGPHLPRAPITGDVIKVRAVGSQLTAYFNGAQIWTGTDSTFPTGQPGIAFFWRAGGDNDKSRYALSSITARNV